MRSQTSYAFSINCDESSGSEKQTLTFFFTGNNVKFVSYVRIYRISEKIQTFDV